MLKLFYKKPNESILQLNPKKATIVMNPLITFMFLVSYSFFFLTPACSQPITLENVIREVLNKSDSTKLMQETMIKSDQLIREKWSAIYPTISASIFGGKSYGSFMGQSSSGKTISRTESEASVVENLYKSTSSSAMDSSAVAAMIMNMVPAMIGAAMQQQASGLSELFKPKETSVYSSSIQVSQPIYTFGKVGTAIEVAKQFDSSVHYTIIRNKQHLQLTALDAFYRVLLTELAMNVTQRSLARKKELYEFLDRNFKLGSGFKAQILSTQADLKGQWSEIINTKQDVRTAKMMLNSLMGRQLTEEIKLDTTAMPQSLTPYPLASDSEMVERAIAQRGDITSLKFLTDATNGGAKIFQAMNYPNIGAQASFGTQGTVFKNLLQWDKRNWMIGVGLQWTLFDGFANSSKSQQFKSDARKLEIIRTSFSKLIAIEVLAAKSECDAADSNMIAAQQFLAAASESYTLTDENFKQGSGQFVELQLAEERLSQAELGIMSATYRIKRSRAALTISMGNDIIQ